MAHYVLNDNGTITKQKKKKNTLEKGLDLAESVFNLPTTIIKGGYDLTKAAVEKIPEAIVNIDTARRNFKNTPIQDKPKVAGMTALNTMRNIGEGSLRTVENAVDAGADIFGDISDKVNTKVEKFVGMHKGESEKDINTKKAQARRKMIEQDTTSAFLNLVGDNPETQALYEKNSLVKENNFGGQLAQNIGQQGTRLLLGEMAGFNNPKSITQYIPIATTAYGSGIEEAYRDGATASEARRYAIASAATEIMTEWATGGIPGVEGSKGGLDKLVEKLMGESLESTSSNMAKYLLKKGYKLVGEGGEEVLSNAINPFLKQFTYAYNNQKDIFGNISEAWANENLESMLNDFIMGAVSAGILEAPSSINEYNNIVNNNRSKEQQNKSDENQSINVPITDKNIQSDINLPISRNDSQNSLNLPINENINTNKNNTITLPTNTEDTTLSRLQEFRKQQEQTKAQLLNQQEQQRQQQMLEETNRRLNTLEQQLEQQGTRILEESETQREAMIENFKQYLEENNITNPTQQDINDSITDSLSYDNDLDFADTAKTEQLYNKYVKEYMQENGIPFNNGNNEYRGSHQIENAKKLVDLNINDIQSKVEELNGYLTKQDQKDLRKLHEIFNHPEEDIKIYRASPVNELNNGDWITTDKAYAKNVAQQNGGKVYEYTVKPSQLYYPDNIRDLPSLHRLSSFQYVEGQPTIPTAKDFNKVNLPKVENNQNNNYNNIKGSDTDVSRTNKNNGTNNVLQNEIDNRNEGNNNTNQEQTNSERNRYVYSPKSYNNGSKTVREIFGENAKTNVNNYGTKLTEEQNNFYKEDKIRNADGNLLVVYHGTKESFEAFDKSKIGSNTHNVGLFGYGFYFTENKSLAASYNWSKEVSQDYEPMALYVNIKNPFYWNNIKTEEQMNNFIKEIGLEEGILEWNRTAGEIHIISDESKSKEFSKALQENGYDGIVYKYDRGQTTSEIVAFEPNQIKSIDNKNPTNSDNIYDKGNIKLPTKKNDKISMPMVKDDNDVIKVASEKIAKQINNTGGFDLKQRSWVETATESDILKDKVYIEDLEPGKISYVVQSNKKSLDSANKRLETYGYEKTLNYVNEIMQSDKLPSASDVALMQRMIQEASKRGDYETVQNLIMDTAIVGTDLGQATQALSIIQRLTPEGQLKMYTKLVQRAKARGEKSFDGVEITPEMVEEILGAYNKNGTYDQEDLNNRVEKFKQDLANQMKSTKAEKIDAWRYLSMLGNPKTHIRNMVSNIAMTGTIKVKNATARTLETILPVKERTKTWKKASKDIQEYAKQTANNMKGIITGENKYNEKSAIESKKQIFKNKTLEKISDFNSNALEAEDWFFSKRAFQSTLQEYLTANGIETYEDIENNPELVEKAKLYAVEQAEIATFRQYSRLASEINKIEKNNKIAKYPLKAVIPFKKTPINVAKAGVKYSPLGLIKNISYDAYQLKQGNINASQFIDNISQGLTGTSLTLLGYALAKAGILSGSGDDDKEAKYDSQLGKQNYSINIGGNSYSISWLSPVAMPLLVGSNAYEKLEEGEGWNPDIVANTLAETLDPLSEMSFVSSLTDVLTSYNTGSSQMIKDIGTTAGQSYVMQFFPTLFSQLAATTDDKKRSTKVSNNSTFKIGEETLRKIMYKIPGLRQQLEVATDVWGNEKEQSSNIIERAFESFIAPYSKTKDISTDLDKEIKRVYNETGENGVIPGIPYAYTKYNGETYKMSANEYTEFKKTYGQTANSTLNSLIHSNSYKNASDEEQAKMIKNVYDYARAKANQEYFDSNDIDYENQILNKIDTLKQNYGISASTYYANKNEYDYAYQNPEKYSVIKQIASYDKYTTYKNKITQIRNNTTNDKQETIKYINSLNMNVAQKAMFIKQYYKSFKQYDKEIVNYINKQKLTSKEKTQILEQLGFTIKDGRVYY